MIDQYSQRFVLDVNLRGYCQFVTFLQPVSGLLVIFPSVFKGAVLHNYPFVPSEFLMSNALVWFELYFNIQLHFFLACG